MKNLLCGRKEIFVVQTIIRAIIPYLSAPNCLQFGYKKFSYILEILSRPLKTPHCGK